jgi:hypothetical protein
VAIKTTLDGNRLIGSREGEKKEVNDKVIISITKP